MSAAACAKIVINGEAGMAVDLALVPELESAAKMRRAEIRYRHGVAAFHGVLDDLRDEGAITSDTRDGWLIRAVQQDQKIIHSADEDGGLEAGTVNAVARWFWRAARELAEL